MTPENSKEHVKALELKFDFEPLLAFYNTLAAQREGSQICLTYRPGREPFVDGCGMAYDAETGQQLFLESEFTELVPGLPESIKKVIEEVRAFTKQNYNKNIGRVRFIRLKFKTCLSYHTDYDEFRLHIPVKKDKKSFFIVDDLVFRMPVKGQLYFLRTNVPHTAVNASYSNDRIHLVFNTADL